jgi:phosphoglycolate phosphatase
MSDPMIPAARSGAEDRPLMVFDLDGTLVDTLDDLLAASNRLLESLHLTRLGPDDIRPMIGDGVAMLVRRVLAARGRPSSPELEARFAADYAANAAGTSRLFEGVEVLLRRLQAEGWRMAVCTNKPAGAARTLLSALGVEQFFGPAVGGGDSFPVRKPDPGHLLGTIALAGGRPERSLLLGDHRNDVLAARGAGIPCLFAGWGFGTAAMAQEADAVATTVADVMPEASRLLERTGF